MEFLNTKQVAEFFGTSLATARQMMKRKDFPLIMVGKNMKVRKDALIKWSEERRV